MIKLGVVDLEIIHLGVNDNGGFDEKDIEKSKLKRLGVGRILDSLASLKDRKLIEMNGDGSFSITDLARHVLWDEQIPLRLKILRLLEIKSYNLTKMSEFLRKTETELFNEIEDLRKNQLVLMSPLRQEEKLIKMYEILPEGIQEINRIEQEGIENKKLENISNPKIEILEMIEQIIQDIDQNKPIIKNEMISKLTKIKEKLEI